MARGLGRIAVGQDILTEGRLGTITDRISAENPSHVYVVGGDERLVGLLISRLRSNGMKTQVVMGTGAPCRFPPDTSTYPATLVNPAGGAGNVAGTIFTSTCQPTATLPEDFVESYTKSIGPAPIGYSAMGYDAANIVLDTLARGAANRSDVISAIRTSDFSGAAGRYRFTETGERDQSTVTVWSFTVRNGTADVAPLPGSWRSRPSATSGSR